MIIESKEQSQYSVGVWIVEKSIPQQRLGGGSTDPSKEQGAASKSHRRETSVEKQKRLPRGTPSPS